MKPDEAASPLEWFAELLGSPILSEGVEITVRGTNLTTVGGIPRAREFVSEAQSQTKSTFGYKWAKRETFEGEIVVNMRRWLVEKYGDVSTMPWLFDAGPNPILLDAGCGAALSALALFEPVLDRVRYIGADVSSAVDVARTRFAERDLKAGFIQADLQQLPLADESVDLIFSEGVLHHTDNTRHALTRVTRHLKPGGRILFYVYAKKGPIREFTDDYIRDQMQLMPPQQGWDAIMPLTKLGKVLGDLNLQIDVPERIDVLDIPAGKIDIQRLFYWHVFKAYHRPEMSLEEMNHINFDWYAPKNAHRHTPQEVRDWCDALKLTIEHERIEEAGITVIAKKAA